jgi:hypothetical protein
MLSQGVLEREDLLVERHQHRHARRSGGAKGVGHHIRCLGLLGAQGFLDLGRPPLQVARAATSAKGRGDLGARERVGGLGRRGDGEDRQGIG